MPPKAPSSRQLAFLAARALDRDVVVRAFTQHLRLSYVQGTAAANEALQRHQVHDAVTAMHLGDLLTASCLLSSFLQGQERATLALGLDQPAGHQGLRAIAVESMRAGQVRAAVSGGQLVRHLSDWELAEELAAAEAVAAAAPATAPAPTLSASAPPRPGSTWDAACTFGANATLTGSRALYGGHRHAVSVVPAVAGSVPEAFATFLEKSEQCESVAHIETVVLSDPAASTRTDDERAALPTARLVSSLGFMAQLLPGGDVAALDDARAAMAEGGGAVVEAFLALQGAGGTGLADALRRAIAGDSGVSGLDDAVFMGGVSTSRWADAVARGRAATDPAPSAPAPGPAAAAAPAAAISTRSSCGDGSDFDPASPSAVLLGAKCVGRAGPLTAAGRFGARVLPQAVLMRAAGIDHSGESHRTGSAESAGEDESSALAPDTGPPESGGPMTAPLDAEVKGWWSKEAFSVVPLHFFCNCSLKGFQGRIAGLPVAELERMVAEVQNHSAAGPGGSSHLVKCHWCASEYELDEPALEAVFAMRAEAERS